MRGHASALTWALIFIPILGSVGSAQTDRLFEKVEIGDLRQSNTPLRRIFELPTTRGAEVVRVGVDLAKTEGVVTFEFGSVSTKLKRASWRQIGDDRFSWAGTGVDSAWESGCLLVTSNSVRGSIYTQQGSFSVEPIGGGLHAITSIDAARFPRDHATLAGAPLAPPSVRRALQLKVPEPAASRTIIDVLVAFAKGAALAHASEAERQAWLDDVINVTNCSYQISGINVELRRTPSSPYLVDYSESGFTTDLRFLMTPGDGKMDEVHTVRANDKADIVVLMVSRAYGFCGRAATTLATKEKAFAMVRVDCAKDKLTFAHEIGHLQGASHQDEEGVKEFSHGRCKDGNGTVMSSRCARRFPQWSRPPSWGSAEKQHNARMLNETASMISSFLP